MEIKAIRLYINNLSFLIFKSLVSVFKVVSGIITGSLLGITKGVSSAEILFSILSGLPDK